LPLCPKCQTELIHVFRTVYRCGNEACKWSGILKTESPNPIVVTEKPRPKRILLGRIAFGTATIEAHQVNAKRMDIWVHTPKPFKRRIIPVSPEAVHIRAELPIGYRLSSSPSLSSSPNEKEKLKEELREARKRGLRHKQRELIEKLAEIEKEGSSP